MKHWVLVRGIVSDEFHWWNLPQLLKKKFPQDSISTADILGNGKTHFVKTPTDIQANVLGLRNQVTASGKKVLVGFSLGGML